MQSFTITSGLPDDISVGDIFDVELNSGAAYVQINVTHAEDTFVRGNVTGFETHAVDLQQLAITIAVSCVQATISESQKTLDILT